MRELHFCTATFRDGTPCRAWAVRGSDPPLCGLHSGAVVLHQPARVEGSGEAAAGFSTEEEITDAILHSLFRRYKELQEYINTRAQDGSASLIEIIRLLDIESANATLLGRVICAQHALKNEEPPDCWRAITQALEEMRDELGIDE